MDENPKSEVVRVAIQRPLYKCLDYNASDFLPQKGCRVRVPLGNTTVTAIVVDTAVKSEFKTLKTIIEVMDEKPLIDSTMMALLKWSSQYYFFPLGEVLFHALPISLRKGRQLPKTTLWLATPSARALPEDELKRAPKQNSLLQLLKEKEHSSQQLLEIFGNSWRNTVRQLEKKLFITQRQVDAEYAPPKQQKAVSEKETLTLTSEQHDCVSAITTYFEETTAKPILLHGITGSGKTEVYLRVITPILEAGKQALVLVPEIGLTPQLLQRFKEHFPHFSIVSLHSGLADGERLQAWIGARSGEVDIVIGTRSAVFTAMNNLGVILVDEEHDASFKQQEGFMYHGRDMAIKRAYELNIPILLGSATPSLETLQNVNRERYHYLRLGSRPGKSKRPEVVVQDIRHLPLEAGISSLMMTEIKQHIQNQHQVMIFLNRRGFAPILMCPSCGWHASCNHCEMGMTYHSGAQKVICHHCGVEESIQSSCPECKSNKLTTQGQGTERIEQVLNNHFPETPVIRIDRDSTAKKGALDSKLEQVHSGEPVILIGTQMLTKGHDFPNLTLVGILDVDQALFSMDYRAQERLAQQILQVSGRAGRGETKGRVVLQTSQPEHPLLISLLSQGYYQTAKNILNERQLWDYPPFGAQALIRVSAMTPEAGTNFLETLRTELSQIINDDVELLGPMPSPLAKRANRYRFQLLMSARNRKTLHIAVSDSLDILIRSRKAGGIRWLIDIDPLDFL